MTIVSPYKSDEKLINNNYRGNYKFASKVECAFAFHKCHLNPQKIYDSKDYTRDLWRCDHPIDLNMIDFKLVVRSNGHLL